MSFVEIAQQGTDFVEGRFTARVGGVERRFSAEEGPDAALAWIDSVTNLFYLHERLTRGLD